MVESPKEMDESAIFGKTLFESRFHNTAANRSSPEGA
jgi:hypothetical protein